MKRLFLAFTVLLFSASIALAQRTLSGTVTAEDGDPLIGATVRVQNTNRGAVTDIDGRYTVEVPEGATTLVISYTGFATQELAIGASNVLDVALAVGSSLNEVVVTALGISRDQKSLSYAVQQIGGERFTEARDANVVNSLSGKIAGVNIVGSSGNVGASSRIVIRGNTSITGENQPLFVVNGVPMDNTTRGTTDNQFGGVDFGNPIQDINPDDIESVSVLKGPNAAALYGSRGANGVIMITTKSGKGAKKGLGLSYTGDVGFSNPFRLPNYQNKFGQGVDFSFDYVDGQGGGLYDGVDESWGPAFDASLSAQDGIDNNGDGQTDEAGEGQTFNQFTGANQPWLARPDNVKNIFQTGVTFSNSFAISAAGENSHARFSFANMDQTGMVPNTDLRRNTFNLGFGVKMSPKWTLEGNGTYTALRSDNRPAVGYAGDNIIQQTIWAGRQVDWDYLRDNYQNRDATGRIVNWNQNYQNNPFFTLYNNTKPQRRDRTNGVASLTYQVTPWLKAMGRIGTDNYTDNREVRYEVETVDYPNGQFKATAINFEETNIDFLLTADKYLTDNISLTVNAGAVRRDNRYSQVDQTANALVVPGVFSIRNADGAVTSDRFIESRRVNSVLGSATIGFYNFIYVDAAVRNDWSSTLPAANRRYLYPSVSASIVLSEKIAIPGVQYLKLRGGYAEAGKDTEPYRLRPVLNANDPWGGLASFTVPADFPNSTLRPERSNSVEFGLELRAAKDRIRFDATYYNTDNVDQIIPLKVSASTGYTGRITNAGTINNNGVELQLGLTPIKTRDFSWDIDLNWAKNNSTVKDLPDGVTEITLNTNWGLRLVAREGEAYGTLVGRRVKRAPDGQIIVSATGRPVQDVDENGLIDNFVLGTITPDWTGGVRNSFRWKNFSLSGLIDMRQGSDIFSMTYIFGRYSGVLEESLEGRNNLTEIQNGYNFGGVVDNGDGTYTPNTVLQSAEAWNADIYNRRHDRGVFDASFIKLREVTFGWDVPKRWYTNTFVGGLRVAAYGRNLALLSSNVPHIDPETAFSNVNAMQGIEFGQTPSARTYGITVNAQF